MDYEHMAHADKRIRQHNVLETRATFADMHEIGSDMPRRGSLARVMGDCGTDLLHLSERRLLDHDELLLGIEGERRDLGSAHLLRQTHGALELSLIK